MKVTLADVIDEHGLCGTWVGVFCAILGAGTATGLPLWVLYKLFFVWLP